jgi:hypothetical protein
MNDYVRSFGISNLEAGRLGCLVALVPDLGWTAEGWRWYDLEARRALRTQRAHTAEVPRI